MWEILLGDNNVLKLIYGVGFTTQQTYQKSLNYTLKMAPFAMKIIHQ